jgi:glycerol-3-phosphate O-acyltransferase / dihydroxyacetone phosphate acyltransferase
MLYAILKLIYKIGLWVFFRRFEVRNQEVIPGEGPLILVSNHPNTFMDPVVVASLLQQHAFFLAKSTVFGSSFTNWLLHHMHLIPIHRREDSPNQPVNNDETFAASFKALADGKAIIIFPEGNSFNERRLRKIKTGTARIALGAEATMPAGVKIIPIGLNYSAPTRFRSRIFVNVGNPIEVAAYMPAYKINPIDTVLALTDQIRVSLESLILHTSTSDDDELAHHIDTIYKQKLSLEDIPAITDQEHEFLRIKAIIRSIIYFRHTVPERVAAISEKITLYMEQLQYLKLRDGVLAKADKDLVKQGTLASIYLFIGFPFYFYGLLHNYIPYVIPSLVARYLTKEEEWYAPIMLTVGIFSFPIFYALEAWLFWHFVPSVIWCSVYLLSLVITGFFTLSYWYTWHYIKEHWILFRLFSKKKNLIHKLKTMRQDIITELEWAHQEYQKQPDSQQEEIR